MILSVATRKVPFTGYVSDPMLAACNLQAAAEAFLLCLLRLALVSKMFVVCAWFVIMSTTLKLKIESAHT